MALEAITGSYLKRVLGDCYCQVYFTYVDGVYESYLDAESAQRMWSHSLELLDSRRVSLKKLQQKMHVTGNKLLAISRSFDSTILRSLSGIELARLWKRYQHVYNTLYGLYVIAAIADRPLLQRVQLALRAKGYTEKQATTIITEFTSAGAYSVVGREELYRQKLARRLLQEADIKELLLRADVQLQDIKPYQKFYRAILVYIRRWNWIPYDFEGKVWSKKKMFNRIIEACKNAKTPIKVSRKTRYGKLPINIKSDCLLLRDMIILRELRKLYVTQSCVRLANFFTEISVRSRTSRVQTKVLLAKEVPWFVQSWPHYKKKLAQRRRMCVIRASKGRLRIMPSSSCEKLIGMLHQCSIDAEKVIPRTFRGVSASAGVVEGPACIVRGPGECKKVHKGDIMVVLNTTPEYMSGITKASGIIADDSATITCHAATIAREYKIPCVVGTRFVMQRVKDGDRIRLDANKGVVTILN